MFAYFRRTDVRLFWNDLANFFTEQMFGLNSVRLKRRRTAKQLCGFWLSGGKKEDFPVSGSQQYKEVYFILWKNLC